MFKSKTALLWFGFLVGFGISVDAEVVIETVTVGNPGNPGELSGEGAGGFGPDRICGAVDYVFEIGKFEVTASQYTEFLNAVAGDDTYELYKPHMWSVFAFGCMIERTDSRPDYRYSVGAEWADRPVNFVSWGDAARFANWLHNGQSTGAQDGTTTEDGSYDLDGAVTHEELSSVSREPDATWVIPSEDEWYKAAYHVNDGVTGNYYDYPTSSDSVPSNDLVDPDPGNNATYLDEGYTIDGPFFRTKVGAHENSDSPYGTFDQGGNVWEWNEGVSYDSFRGVRAGSFDRRGSYLHAANRYHASPTPEYHFFGYRVALICGDRGTLTAYQSFADCLIGPRTLASGACMCANLDGDNNVDLADFALLQRAFTGPE